MTKKPGDFRRGKTKRDKESGSWSQRLANLQARGDRDRGKERTKGGK